MSQKIPVIIDCDPGHDDALAILWALGSNRFDIKAITTVAGNQTIEKVTRNALITLTKANQMSIPVAVGAKKPLLKDLVIGGQLVHGDSGLEGPKVPKPAFKPISDSAFACLVNILQAQSTPMTIIALGPLTNLATLLLARPDLKTKIERISLMGGGTFGNWTPAAEYNIFADPQAAKIVFNSNIPIIMAGLDVTQKAYITREENEQLRKQGNSVSVFAAELIDFFSKYHYQVEGFAGCTLHDPTAIAALIYPELFESVVCHVDVETTGELTSGMTLVDKIGYKEKLFNVKVDKNTTFLTGVNRVEYISRFLNDLKQLG